jgi:seryl-tRNA synthetase
MLWSVGNVLEDDVPIGNDEEEDNLVTVKWGDIPDLKIDAKTPGHYHHN